MQRQRMHCELVSFLGDLTAATLYNPARAQDAGGQRMQVAAVTAFDATESTGCKRLLDGYYLTFRLVTCSILT